VKIFRNVMLVLVVLYVIHIFYEMGGGSKSSMHEMQEQVADDQVRQWLAVSKDPNHTQIEVCVHAGLVAQAYLQAGDDDQYHKWEKKAKDECPEGAR
jgi:hypothetical protein